MLFLLQAFKTIFYDCRVFLQQISNDLYFLELYPSMAFLYTKLSLALQAIISFAAVYYGHLLTCPQNFYP